MYAPASRAHRGLARLERHVDRRRTLPQLARSVGRRARRLGRANAVPEAGRALLRTGLRVVPPAARVHLLGTLARAYEFQISPEAMAFVRPRLGPGSRLLVFGAGRDTPVWATLNRHGRTVIVEDHPRWAALAARNRGVEVVTVTYTTTVADSHAYGSPAAVPVPALPDDVRSERWDVIVVDAPAAWGPEMPGRAAPFVLAQRLVTDTGVILLDDCFRDHERRARAALFDRPADAYVDPARPVALYLADPSERRSVRTRSESGAGPTRLLTFVTLEDPAPSQDAIGAVAGPEQSAEIPVRAELRADADGIRVVVHGTTVARMAAAQADRLLPVVRDRLDGRIGAHVVIVDESGDDPESGGSRVGVWFDRCQSGPAGVVLLPDPADPADPPGPEGQAERGTPGR